MKKIIKMNILAILLIVWALAVSAADSLEGWLFVLDMFLCSVPLAVITWLCSKGWLDDIDMEE